MKFHIFALVALLNFEDITLAQESKSFFSNKKKGWFFDDGTTPELKPEVEKPTDTAPIVQAPPMTPTEIINAQKASIEASLHRAIITRDENDVKDYLMKTNAAFTQAEGFGEAYKNVLMKNPDLDPSVQNPVDANSLRVSQAKISEEKLQKIRDISKRYGFVYFYSSECPYCQAFSPVLKSISESANMQIAPFTINGGVLPSFPKSGFNLDLARSFKVQETGVPALFIVDPDTDRHELVSKTSASYDVAIERIIFAAGLFDRR